MGSLLWGSPMFNTWRYRHTQRLCHREPCDETPALAAPPQRYVREPGEYGGISERSEVMVIRQSPYSTGESWGPASPLLVSEEQVPPFSKHGWSQQGYSPGTEELSLTRMC